MCIWNVSKKNRHCSLCKVSNCEDRVIQGRRGGKVMPTLMNLRIGKTSSFTADQCNAVRTAICYLRRDYDMNFSYSYSSDIQVTRLK